jgi:hypothetical protein
MPRLDHLLFGVPDLSSGIARMETLLGVRAVVGGRHPDFATHNALLGLGEGRYLELIAPDPDAAAPRPDPPFGLATLAAGRLVTWVASDPDLEGVGERARRLGEDLGAVRAGSRRRPDGGVLTWRTTDPWAKRMDGILPFFIDWGATPHPSATAVPGCTLVALRAEHPDPPRARRVLQALGLDLPVTAAALPALIATLRTARGETEVR